MRGTKEQLEELHTLDGVQECRIVREVPEESAESSENDLTDAAETLDSDAGEGTTKQPEFHLSLIAGENCDLRETVFRYCVELMWYCWNKKLIRRRWKMYSWS